MTHDDDLRTRLVPAAPPSTEDKRAFVTPTQLAVHWHVHPNTIYRDIGKGALPAYRMPGGQLRIRIADAKRYGKPVT